MMFSDLTCFPSSSLLLQINRAPSFGTDQKIDYDVKKGVLLNALKLLNIRYYGAAWPDTRTPTRSRSSLCANSIKGPIRLAAQQTGESPINRAIYYLRI